jgi:hypothetical protein
MPWASVVAWDRPDGAVWGKAMCPGFASECRLLPLLAEHAPNAVLRPIRADVHHGLLLPDGGPTIEDHLSVDRWTKVLLGYAELQRALVGNDDAILAAGCVDLRPHRAVQRLEQHMASGNVERRPHLLEWLHRVAAELGDAIPATIQHDDLQPSNVLADGRILDWGDASLAHPFASLLTALARGTDRRPGTDAERDTMSDAYLRSWAPLLGRDAHTEADMVWLRRQAALAQLLAPIGRIDTWLRAPAEALVMYPDAIDRWMRHLETQASLA